jgi:hypothetical protein
MSICWVSFHLINLMLRTAVKTIKLYRKIVTYKTSFKLYDLNGWKSCAKTAKFVRKH